MKYEGDDKGKTMTIVPPLRQQTMISNVLIGNMVAILAIGMLSQPVFVSAEVVEPPAVELDCSIYETKSMDLGLAFKVAQFIFNVGPEVSFSKRSGVAWDKVVHGTIARYVELCNRYNAGLVSKTEYETRLKEIEALYKETKEMEAKLYDATRNRAKDAFGDLDAEFGRNPFNPRREEPSSNVNIDRSVEKMAQRIDNLEPLGSSLTPAPPCPVPKIPGTIGVKEDRQRDC